MKYVLELKHAGKDIDVVEKKLHDGNGEQWWLYSGSVGGHNSDCYGGNILCWWLWRQQ